MQDTGKFRNQKDQFYTKESVAQSCIECILTHPLAHQCLWVEPSAGDGVFLRNVPSTIPSMGMDIEPHAVGILQQDYLTWTPPRKEILVFGNPPFGRQSALAKLFIRKSCEFASMIAFILPRSFTKPSMFHVFPPSFHLLDSIELDSNSFLVNGTSYDVPCVFQIWQRQQLNRPVHEKVSPQGFTYVKDNTYHFACRRVGVFAGKCYLDDRDYSIQSHYFIRLNDHAHVADIVERMNRHTFPSNTVGPRSLSQTEINEVLNEIIKNNVGINSII
jgi:hypothetical protein